MDGAEILQTIGIGIIGGIIGAIVYMVLSFLAGVLFRALKGLRR